MATKTSYKTRRKSLSKKKPSSVKYKPKKEKTRLLAHGKIKGVAEIPPTYQKIQQNIFLDMERISKTANIENIQSDLDIAGKGLKQPNPNKLPFLHAQVLGRIYFNISAGENVTLDELAKITDYPSSSKILLDAIESLIEKGFLKGSVLRGFQIPACCGGIYNKVINKFSNKQKKYSKRLIDFLNSPNSYSLFEQHNSISELNKHGVVHKWYNYLEEFPYSLIEKKIKDYEIKIKSLIVDPFCGSGTTLVAANLFHSNAVGFDANPLMTFISKIKTTWDIDLKDLREITLKVAHEFLGKVRDIDKLEYKSRFLKNMSKRELNQWLSITMQREVALLKDIIDETKNEKIKNMLFLAMAKACFDGSYVALCPGTTFYPFREKEDFWDIFTNKIIQIYNDLKEIQKHDSYGKSTLITDTCLNARKYLKDSSIDFIITSPPYPNDLEYTRQTRLEMYLLDFVNNMDDVQQIKRKMVKGSTKLIFRESNSAEMVNKFSSVKNVSEQIYEKLKTKNWGFDYPRMVREYFGDMYLCLKEFLPLMKNDAHFLLVVGDQTIKGVYIPVCDILIELAKEIGYKDCHKELFRNRRSSAHTMVLPEEIVVLKK